VSLSLPSDRARPKLGRVPGGLRGAYAARRRPLARRSSFEATSDVQSRYRQIDQFAVGLASVDDINDAIAAAERGFEAWKRVPAFKRSDALHAASQRMQERSQEIARLLTLEQGKPLAEALAEVASTVNVIRWYAEEARRVYGRIIPPRVPGSSMKVLREPVGPCAAFSPWNFPLMLASRKLAGALATGCSVVLKAEEEAPASVAKMVECFLESDLPDGALQLLYGVRPRCRDSCSARQSSAN
jgi:acyl-CoA reductase-like NAD-dependent aldehyde dehydrogenase